MNDQRIFKSFKRISRILILAGLVQGTVTVSAGPALAEGQDKSIATLTEFSGDVLVRKKLKWDPVTKVPLFLFSGDKVVTQKGRAKIDFRDGSHVDLDLDSNVKITERKTSKGLIFKKQVKERTVKVSLGKVLFKVKKKKGLKNNLKTPTMAAAIRGSSAGFEVRPGGATRAIDIEGDMSFSGDFDPLKTFNAPRTDVPDNELPARDPALANTVLQKSAKQASDNHVTAHNAMVAAQNKVKAAQKKVDQAQSADDQVATGKELARASAELAKTQNQVIGFFSSVVAEIKAEASQFKQSQGQSAAEEQIKTMQEQAVQVAAKAQAAQDNSDIALLSNDPIVVLALAESAKANWNTAKALAQAGNLRAHLAEANGIGNSDAVDIVEQMVELSEKNIHMAQHGNQNVPRAMSLVSTSLTEQGKKVALNVVQSHAHATKSAATANMAANHVASSAVSENIEEAESSMDHAMQAAKTARDSVHLSETLLKIAESATSTSDPDSLASQLEVSRMGRDALKSQSHAIDMHMEAAKMVSMGGSQEKITQARQKAQDSSHEAKNAVSHVMDMLDSMD